jgi:CheY-like chemotaxis protein
MSRTAVPQKIPRKRILVVDDEPQVATTIKMVLSLSGHTVEIVDDAEKALAAFEIGKYDLIVTDQSLGKMTGLQLAHAIKERSAAQPIILVTAYAESMAMEKDGLADVDHLMGKPFSLDELQAALEAIFPAP